MLNSEPLLYELIHAAHKESSQVAARFRPYGFEFEQESLPPAFPKPGRNQTLGITAAVLGLNRFLVSIREMGVAVQARLFPAHAAVCSDSACC